MTTLWQAGAAIGSLLGGVLFEATSGYGAAFTVACVLLLGACALSLTIQERFTLLPYPHPVAGGR